MTIDSLGLEACNIIQLDVEGFEQYAIAGAVKTLEKFRPVIVAERFNSSDNQHFMHTLRYKLRETSANDAIYTHEDT
jgi:hypothetical protein